MNSDLETEEKSTAKAVRAAARDEFMKEFGRRCKLARGALSIEAVATQIGVHRNTVWNIERGDSLPDAFDLHLLARVYKTTPERLMASGSASEQFSASFVQKSTRAVEQEGFVYVPVFDIRVSAGDGAFNDLESVLAMQPFESSFIRRDLGITHNEMAMTSVAGVSMEPWLRSKDMVLTDLRDRDAMTEGIHVVRLDGALLIKKLQRLPGKVLRVSSFNQSYEPFDIQTTEESDRDFQVIGRVRWGGVTFN